MKNVFYEKIPQKHNSNLSNRILLRASIQMANG
jgi:hypothetical protein